MIQALESLLPRGNSDKMLGFPLTQPLLLSHLGSESVDQSALSLYLGLHLVPTSTKGALPSCQSQSSDSEASEGPVGKTPCCAVSPGGVGDAQCDTTLGGVLSTLA